MQSSIAINRVSLILLLCLAILSACQSYEQRSCLALNQSLLAGQSTLKLNQYQVVIQQKSIKGIENLSGLTWNNDTKTLFAVTNKRGEILELSPQGDLLRVIETLGIRDAEAIEYLGNNEFIIADERFQKLFTVTIDKDTTSINGHIASQLTVAEQGQYNRGLEGLAYDNKLQVIYAANESNPLAIYKINHFFDKTKPVSISPYINKNSPLLIKDISGLHFYQPYAHLLVLSDESKLLLELTPQAQAISCLPLTAGQQGLSISIRQPEGVTLDDEDNLYIVSEPNLFYKFKKQITTP